MRSVALALALAAVAAPVSRAQEPVIPIIPRPDSIEVREGGFTLRDPVRIRVASSEARLREAAAFLRHVLVAGTGYRVSITQGRAPAAGAIVLALEGSRADSEAYTLSVTPQQVRLTAAGAPGVVWGIQTLRQLLPPAFEGGAARRASWTIPAVVIRDRPRFAWRGSLLDAGRHFFPVADVERFIDLLSRYKLNVLHWHLTDDQGWRIAIRRYPRLTTVGAWRIEEDGSRYGGFYTQQEVRAVVAYARRRAVTVVPEIEMPGHSSAAIAAYPWLGCTGDSIAVPHTWGVFEDVYCVGNERTFTFLEAVLDEVTALFPSRYIHIGGDEVPKDRWRACESCQALMRREGLPDEAALQSWFTRRITRSLLRRGRRLIGWDEIMEGGLPPGAVVQVWRDTATIRAAILAGADVIASPTSYAYLDYSPAILPLAKVFAFDPVPAGLLPEQVRHVLGGEAPLWSERIVPGSLDLVALPRLLAFADVLWSARAKDYDNFLARLVEQEHRLVFEIGVGVGPSDRDLLRLTPIYDSTRGRMGVRVERGTADVEVRFTTDGSTPTPASPLALDTTWLGDTGIVTLQAFVQPGPMPARLRLVLVTHLAAGRSVALATPPDPRYAGTGPRTLTDGAFASTDLHDGLWQGWQGPDLDAVIDLGERRALSAVEGSFLQDTRSWVLLPRGIRVWLSDDDSTWSEAGTATHEEPAQRMDPFRYALRVSLPAGATARYVRVLAANSGTLPAWHPGAGHPSWIFADELVVR